MHGSIATDAPLYSSDWKWQQKNLINSTAELLARFPGLAGSPQYQNIEHNLESRKLGLTPYLANLIKTDAQQRPVSNDPIWLQVAPVWARPEAQRFEYDGESENWELPHEMVTDICQHKYDNRVIIRTANVCHAYCQFCYEALRTLETDTQKKAFKKSEWQQTVDYIATHPAVEEVILSGGEPLMLSDERLESLLSSLRAARPDIIIRLHTRALSFNPYRITDALVEVLKKGRVNAVGLHVSHRQEITDDFLDAVAKLQRAVPLLFANIPLLGGINDSYVAMKDLCMTLYANGVLPHYLYQFMPFSPGSEQYRTQISSGIAIVSHMKRRLSNMAVPEFVLPHRTGKYSVPLDLLKPPAELRMDAAGLESMAFVNWQGDACVFPE